MLTIFLQLLQIHFFALKFKRFQRGYKLMLKLKQNPFKYLFIFLAGFFFVCLCAQIARIKSENKKEHKAFIEATAGTESFFRKSKNFSIYFEIPDRNHERSAPKTKTAGLTKN